VRQIFKGEEPAELHRWKIENVETPQVLTYRNMPRAQVKNQMLREQCFLCAYTMQEISSSGDCHIEHIVP
jgi:hypothetical protein